MDALTKTKEQLIIELYLTFCDLSKVKELSDEDLDLWVLLTKHSAIQKLLNDKC